MSTVRVLERPSRVAPLGVRFWDALTRSFVSEGLRVVAHPPAAPSRRSPVRANRSGVFVAQDLPGMREVEMGRGDPAYWASAPRAHFVIEVDDAEGRYLPFSFTADLPAQGLFVGPGIAASPPPDEPRDGVLLFSAPARRVAAGIASIHAELWDATAPSPAGAPLAGAPAAGAVLTARIAGEAVGTGVADAEGRVALFFSYPEPLGFPDLDASPLATPAGAALTDQSWPISLSVRYARATPRSAHPDVAALLGQPAASLIANPATSAPFSPPPLRFGEALTLRSMPSISGAAGPSRTKLFLSPA